MFHNTNKYVHHGERPIWNKKIKVKVEKSINNLTSWFIELYVTYRNCNLSVSFELNMKYSHIVRNFKDVFSSKLFGKEFS